MLHYITIVVCDCDVIKTWMRLINSLYDYEEAINVSYIYTIKCNAMCFCDNCTINYCIITLNIASCSLTS